MARDPGVSSFQISYTARKGNLLVNRYFLCACLAAVPVTAVAQTPCEQLKSLRLADTTVTLTESSGPGAFQLPGAPPAALAPFRPAFCRVAAPLKPSFDSDLQ